MFINPKNHIKLILVIILGNIFLLSACDGDDNTQNNTNTNAANQIIAAQEKKASDNIEGLLNIIRLPEIPEEVVWKEEVVGSDSNRVPGPNDRKLIAVLRYIDKETEDKELGKSKTRLMALLEKGKNNGEVEVPTEEWFPEELVARAQLSGNESVKGISYSASDFVNIPYGNGRITHIENTDYFILELFTN